MLSPLHQEKDLLLQLAEDNELAFEKIYKLYSARLFGNLLKLVKSEAHAQEILQDVFLKIWEHRRSIDPDKSFRSFIFKIAENKVHDFFRKTARDKKRTAELVVLSADWHIESEDFMLSAIKSDLLLKAIESLPAQRQQVFRLCKLEGKSYNAVSELLGISVSTISDHIVKGTKAVRDYVASHAGEMQSLILCFYLFQ